MLMNPVVNSYSDILVVCSLPKIGMASVRVTVGTKWAERCTAVDRRSGSYLVHNATQHARHV
jgi:hypothetical protein